MNGLRQLAASASLSELLRLGRLSCLLHAHALRHVSKKKTKTNTNKQKNRQTVGRGSVGRAAGRWRSTQGVEATAAIGGPGAVYHVPEATGLDRPHHTTFITASGHEVDLRRICTRDVKAQATVESELALV